MQLGSLSINFVLNLLKTTQALGGNNEQLKEQFQLSESLLSDPDNRISIARFMRMGDSAIRQLKRPDLGLEMGRHSQLQTLGLTGLAARCAPDFDLLCQTLTQFEALFSENIRGQTAFIKQGRKAYLRFYSIAPYNRFNLFVVDSVLAGWYQMLYEVNVPKGLVQAVHFEFPAPAYSASYETLFSCPVLFSQNSNQLILTSAMLSRGQPFAHKANFQQLTELCRKRLETQRLNQSLSHRLQSKLTPLLPQGQPRLEQLAELMGVRSWTLRRQLKQQGLGFQQIINETRRDTACKYIHETEYSFGEIAYLLGFSSAVAFQRAFKRWTGETPGEYRRQLHRKNSYQEQQATTAVKPRQ